MGGRFAHIDALRCLALMLVVVAHAGAGVVPGGSGVTIFFAISGFIITYLAFQERDQTGSFALGRFYARRLLKLGPPLVALIFMPTAIYGLAHRLSLAATGSQVFFFFNWRLVHGMHQAVLPGSGVLWSLSIEEQFYVVFAVIWWRLARRSSAERWMMVIAGVVVVASVAEKAILASDPAVFNRIGYGTDTRIDAIALGILAAGALRYSQHHLASAGPVRRTRLPQLTLPAAVLLFSLTLLVRNPVFRDTVRYPLQAVAACVVVLFGFLADSGWASWAFNRLVALNIVQLIGRASYSIYLVHEPLHAALAPDLPRTMGASARAIVFIILPVVAGLIAYVLIELPVGRARTRWRSHHRATPID